MTPPRPLVVQSIDGAITATWPPDLVPHRHLGAVMGTVPDGSMRVAVEIAVPDSLIRHAGAGKDSLRARGWDVEAEKHYELAIFLRLRRGGTAPRPAERREIWWVQRASTVYRCDVLVRPAAFGRLGEPVKELCQGVRVVAAPEPLADAADTDSEGEPANGGAEAGPEAGAQE